MKKVITLCMLIILATIIVYNVQYGKIAKIEKMYDKEIFFPLGGNVWQISKRDCSIDIAAKQTYKIIAYYNAKGCLSCRFNELLEWQRLIDESTLSGIDVDFIFIYELIDSVVKKNLEISMQLYQHDLPILFYTTDIFERYNKLPKDEKFHYFLLDKDNKICVIGSPIGNSKMWSLYKKRIASGIST